MLTVRRRRLSSRVFREALCSFPIEINGCPVDVEAGDFVDAELIRTLPRRGTGLLGKTLTTSQVAALMGGPPEGDRFVIRREAACPAVAQAAPVPCFDIPAIALIDGDELEDVGDSPAGIMVHDEDVVLPLGSAPTASILRAAANMASADIVYPAHNLAEPCSLPMNGDSGSPLARMPGGLSTWEIAQALASRDFQAIDATPTRPGCAYLSPKAVAHIQRGLDPTTLRRATTARAFVWRTRDRRGPTAVLTGETGRGGTWPSIATQARAAAIGGREGRPPVVFYSTAVGPWGGVGVLFRLADELQRHGVHAHVVYSTDVPHHFRPQTAPLKIPNSTVLVRDWQKAIGGDAILVASHWGSAHRVLDVSRAHPDVLLTSILQDREDMFISPRGRSLARDVRDAYLSIGRGASVSRWILDSAHEELALGLSKYRVIHAGLDLDIFRPSAGARRTSGPVRVLAMWRPQTNDRRGGALLHQIYDELRRRFRDTELSLEVFGWLDPTSPAPKGVTHHGVLAPPEVAALMASVDIVVEPSQYQGFGLPAAEAAACGACVVSTTNRGIDEWGVHEKNALVVPHDQMIEAVGRAIKDPELRARLAPAGLEAVQKFGWREVGRQWAAYLAELYASERPTGCWADAWAEVGRTVAR